MHVRKHRIVSPYDRQLRDNDRRSAAVDERSRNLEIWVAIVTWLLTFGIVGGAYYGSPVVALAIASVAAAGAFFALRAFNAER
jgi:hypothetical protein